jgi:hypothetical protein
MTKQLRAFIRRQCAVASSAYAAGIKRLGQGYYGTAVAALYHRATMI